MSATPGGPLDSGGLVGPPPGRPSGLSRRYDQSALRSTLVALASTLVFFGVAGWIVVNSPGWPDVQQSFFNGAVWASSVPDVVPAFVINVELFCVAEVLILVLALLLAVLRSLPGPVFFPLRLLATAYADLFRALPGILIIFLLGFGIPGLNLPNVPNSPFFWAVVSLTLIYSAYVSEVYRAGIQSVHPSQEAAARSLGLSQLQALRYVILPQAIRRVIPPLLNDFIGLQKDTVLVSYIGVIEVFNQSGIDQRATFNMTPYMVTALIFLVITVPLARFVDVLIARDRRRYMATAR